MPHRLLSQPYSDNRSLPIFRLNRSHSHRTVLPWITPFVEPMDQAIIARLRKLLGEEDVWSPPDPVPTNQPENMPTSTASRCLKDPSSESNNTEEGAKDTGNKSSAPRGRAGPKPLI